MGSSVDEQYYEITLSTPILLYGYTKKAQDIAVWLTQKSYHVKGYIDVRAEQIISDGRFPVYDPDHLDACGIERCEMVVILCFQNIMTQIKVADNLFEKGIEKIIYLPDSGMGNSDMTGKMRQIYQKVCLKESLLDCPIPTYGVMLESKSSVRVVKEFENDICILCPVQLIYSGMPYSKNLWQIKDIDIYKENVIIYEDKNIVLDKLYGSFFDYMMTGKENCEVYIETFARMSKKNKDNYFRDRVELFELYEKEYENNINFFMETPAAAEWNRGGYFNLGDGHHRVQYLYKKGHYFMPIIISKKDYKLYVNAEKEAELQKYLMENDIDKQKNFEVSNRFDGKRLLTFQIKQLITEWEFLSEQEGVTGNSYLDASDSAGFFAINMSRMHAQNVTIAAKDMQEEGLLKLICELTYQSGILIIRNENIDLNYDVIFAGKLEDESVFQNLYQRAARFYFFSFQRGDENCQMIIDRVCDAKYQKILEYSDGGNWMESGVLIKM